MALSWIDISIIVAILLLFVYIGTRAKSNNANSVEAYFLGDRKLPWWLAGTSMVATTFAADTPLAVNELVVKYGVSGNWLWWNMLAGGMLTSLFFAHLWRRAHITTDVELIHIRYSGFASKILRAFKAIYMGVFMNVLIIGWVNLALISLVEVFFDIHDKGTLLLIIFASMVLVFLYSGFSGFLSVIYTDFVQFILAMTGSIVLAVLVINSKDIGGLSGLISQLNESQLSFFPSFDKDLKGMFSISIFSFFTFISMPWWTSWYPGAEPGGGGYIAQRIMGTKDEKNAIYSSIFFQIAHYCIRPWPWILVGLSTIIIYGDSLQGQERMGYVWAMKDFLPEGLKGILLASFLAAYMSTISTQLNWGASYIVNDLYVPFFKKDHFKIKEITVSQLTVFVLILLSLISTSYINSISAVWSLLVKCGAGLGLVLILRWYWWRVNAWSEISASLAPFVAYAFCVFYMVPNYGEVWNAEIIDDPRSFIFIVSFTTIVWIVVTFLTPATDLHTLHSFYNRVRPDGFWPFHEIRTSRKSLVIKIILWFVSIVGAYSFLFSMGAYLLNQPTELYIFVSLTIVSLVGFWYLTNKYKLFSTIE